MTDNGIPCSHTLLCLSTYNLIVLWLKSDCFYLVSQQELSQHTHFTKHMWHKSGVLQWASTLQRDAPRPLIPSRYQSQTCNQPIRNLIMRVSISLPCIKKNETHNSPLNLFLGVLIFSMLNWSGNRKGLHKILNDDLSPLVLEMTSCLPTTGYLRQSGSRFIPSYAVTMEQWVNSVGPGDAIRYMILFGSSWYQIKQHCLSCNTHMAFCRPANRNETKCTSF